MYTELDKYKTGKIVENKDEYSFNLGDLLLDFDKHLSKWFWQRKSYHNDLTQTYVKILNEISFKRSF